MAAVHEGEVRGYIPGFLRLLTKIGPLREHLTRVHDTAQGITSLLTAWIS